MDLTVADPLALSKGGWGFRLPNAREPKCKKQMVTYFFIIRIPEAHVGKCCLVIMLQRVLAYLWHGSDIMQA